MTEYEELSLKKLDRIIELLENIDSNTGDIYYIRSVESAVENLTLKAEVIRQEIRERR